MAAALARIRVGPAGHAGTGPGPYGCLPTDPARLTDELARRASSPSASALDTGRYAYRGGDGELIETYGGRIA